VGRFVRKSREEGESAIDALRGGNFAAGCCKIAERLERPGERMVWISSLDA
jgi:hypothetical protein